MLSTTIRLITMRVIYKISMTICVLCTVNPRYTDTRYNYKFRYTDNLTTTETLS